MKRIIEITSVKKSFDNINVLNDINLKINSGEIFGLLGPSGAGKTTLIKLLIGQIKPSEGVITVFGRKTSEFDDSTYASFGMVLDSDGLYERLTCYDNLEIYARIYGLSDKKERIIKLLELVELQQSINVSVSKLSKGMRQRLSFARAILHEPKIVFLDEPTGGLDPTTTKKIHSIMNQLRKQGVTIFLTTHNMEEAKQMCDRVALLDKGKIVELGTPNDLCIKHCQNLQIRIITKNGLDIICDNTTIYKTIQRIIEAKDSIVCIHSNEPDLEKVFVKLTGGGL